MCIRKHGLRLVCALALSAILAGCDTPEGKITLGIVGAAVIGGQAPTNEIEQTYYLGIFDEQEQVPPAVYRVRLRGQASAISAVNFASGWLPAEFVDTLGTSIAFDKKSGKVKFDKPDNDQSIKDFKTGRRLILFGPEGFREAPANHRLVVVMGSNADAFFSSVNESVGTIASAIQGTDKAISDEELFQLLLRIKRENEELERVVGPVRHNLEGGS